MCDYMVTLGTIGKVLIKDPNVHFCDEFENFNFVLNILLDY